MWLSQMIENARKRVLACNLLLFDQIEEMGPTHQKQERRNEHRDHPPGGVSIDFCHQPECQSADGGYKSRGETAHRQASFKRECRSNKPRCILLFRRCDHDAVYLTKW